MNKYKRHKWFEIRKLLANRYELSKAVRQNEKDIIYCFCDEVGLAITASRDANINRILKYWNKQEKQIL